MKEITLLKTFNKWRRGAGIPQPEPAAIGRAIDIVIADFESLQAQNDELRAKLDLIQDAYLDVEIKAEVLSVEQDDESNAELAKAHYILGRAIGKTPAQSLSDIRAEAVMSIVDLDDYVFAEDGSTAHTVEQIIEYANRIKEG